MGARNHSRPAPEQRVEEQLTFDNVTAALGYVPGLGSATTAYVDAGDAATLAAAEAYTDAAIAGLPSGSGDVVGPASATDNAVALFDGTTGKLLQDSGVTLDTDGALAADSDLRLATQKAVKAYVDALPGGSAGLGIDTAYEGVLSASRSAGAETVSYGAVGSVLSFRDATATVGAYNDYTLAGALTLTIPSGATLGVDKAATATLTIASPGVITYANHRMRPDDAFVFTTTGALPTGITAGTTYYVSATGFTHNSFQFSTTVGGASVNTSGSQSGTHTLTWTPKTVRIWVVVADDGGTLRLGVIRCTDNNRNTYPLRDDSLTSSTAIGTGSDSAGVIYSGSAWTSKPTRVVGYLEYLLPVAGTWDTAPSWVQLWGKGMHLPGEIIQSPSTDVPTAASGTTTVPGDATTPQSTEGDQYFSLAFTATSVCNVLDWECYGAFESTASTNFAVSFFKDTEVNAINTGLFYTSDASRVESMGFRTRTPVFTASAMTGKVRAGSNGAGTTRINTNVGGTFTYGGAYGSSFRITEIMG